MKRLLLAFIAALSCAGSASAAVIKEILAGATDQSVVIRIIDSTDGTPETGVAFNTSGIDLEYWRHGANSVVDITEATQTVNGAHSDGGFVHLGNGLYRLDLPDAAVAASASAVEVMGTVTGMIVMGGTVQLTTNVAQTGDSFARLGAPAGASVSADIAAIEAQTDDIGAAGAGLTALATQASVNTIDTEVGVIDGIVDAILVDTGTTLQGEIDGVQADTEDLQSRIPAALVGGRIDATVDGTGMEAAAVAAIADGVWDEAISGHAGAGSTGEALSSAGGGGASDQELGIARQGTAQSATATTLVMDSSAAFADDTAIGMTVVACGSTQGYCQSRAVTDNVLSTDTLTVETWTVTPSGTITYYLYATAPSSGGGSGLDAAGVRAAIGLASANLDTQLATIDTNVDDIETDTGTTLPATLSTIAGYIDTEVAAILVDTGTTLQGELDGIQADTEDLQARIPAALVGGRIDATVDGTGLEAGALTALADAVWDEAQSGHVSAGTFGAYLDSAVSGVSTGGVSAADIADAVWDEAQSGHVGAGTFGEVATEIAAILVDTGTTLQGEIDAIEADVDAILVDTGTTLQGEIDGVQADTENIQTRLPAALNNGVMPADVQRINDVEIVGDGSGTPFNVP